MYSNYIGLDLNRSFGWDFFCFVLANIHTHFRKFGLKTEWIMYSDYGRRIQRADVSKIRANEEIVGCVWYIQTKKARFLRERGNGENRNKLIESVC